MYVAISQTAVVRGDVGAAVENVDSARPWASRRAAVREASTPNLITQHITR